MILIRTPFRLSLGGGSTDLPAYYERYGGFIFAVTINLYMYVGINRPPTDDLIRLKYRESEEVTQVGDLKHSLTRVALQHIGVERMVDIFSVADIPDGTGLGSSATFLVGLLNALHTLQGDNLSRRHLAEEAFELATQNVGLPDGKQDFYLASFGNFCVLEIAPNGAVAVANANITHQLQKEFERRTLLFYTGVRRSSFGFLRQQQIDIENKENKEINAKHRIKEIGRKILYAFENHNLDKFGQLLDEHWQVKRSSSTQMSNDVYDTIYKKIKKHGALGGKIVGAGGGGFFMVFCQEGAQEAVRNIFKEYHYREVEFQVDSAGTKILLNSSRSNTM